MKIHISIKQQNTMKCFRHTRQILCQYASHAGTYPSGTGSHSHPFRTTCPMHANNLSFGWLASVFGMTIELLIYNPACFTHPAIGLISLLFLVLLHFTFQNRFGINVTCGCYITNIYI